FSNYESAKLNADNEEIIDEIIDRIKKIILREELESVKKDLVKYGSNDQLINKYQELLKKLT
ncbi:MAG: hypothetical protein Q4B23_02315, partial [Helcococcus sp.]|nr:hypothetical protein [Helcococcus sp.]